MNRNWADAAVEITTTVAATFGPIGFGVLLIGGAVVMIVLFADRRGWLRPSQEKQLTASDVTMIAAALASVEHKLGSNEAKHDMTHDMIRDLRRDIL